MNEITYTQIGDYLLPNIILSESSDASPIGRFGKLHQVYLKEHKLSLYNQLLMTERLFPILRQIDEAANDRLVLASESNQDQIIQGIMSDLVYC